MTARELTQDNSTQDDAFVVHWDDPRTDIADTVFDAADEGHALTVTSRRGKTVVLAPYPAKVYVVTGDHFVFAVRSDEAEAQAWVEKNASGLPRGTTEHQWCPEHAGKDVRQVHRFKDPNTGRWNKSRYYITTQVLDSDN
ncbi:hypothetical protein [Streptomyces nanshensis]|uniref:Uncharacterized protein n=1 Tax=Streptomyces nanshensis TaxID=518642 RepID=A0A1E7LC42_9ACTN|nr:hypothetical protein [Streptomyces nanshensis]OEV13789.1 hypothetical protein AN218_01775 [Streptomyces nanshensis]